MGKGKLAKFADMAEYPHESPLRLPERPLFITATVKALPLPAKPQAQTAQYQ